MNEFETLSEVLGTFRIAGNSVEVAGREWKPTYTTPILCLYLAGLANSIPQRQHRILL